MEYTCFVPSAKAAKAEEALRKDFDLAAKQSIVVRDAKTLDIDAKGSFFLISGSDEGVAHCKELLKEFVEEIDSAKIEQAKKKVKEEQDSAAAGFGGIFG